MAAITTMHHYHAATALPGSGPGMHIVWNEAILIPLTIMAMLVFVRRKSVWALHLFGLIALFGFLGLGLYEGGWNHTAKLLAHLRLEGTGGLRRVLPPDEPHRVFHELSGIATFIAALVASDRSWRFWRAGRSG